MTLKTLVTGVAAAALVGGAAAGVTSIASASISASPAVQPVVFDAPLPAAPAPDLEGPLNQTLTALAGGGSFAGKSQYIQGGIGRIESRAADRAYSNAAAKGLFPLTFNIANIDDNGAGMATADVTATASNGQSASQPIQFVAGPSPTGWQVSKQSAMALLSAVG